MVSSISKLNSRPAFSSSVAALEGLIDQELLSQARVYLKCMGVQCEGEEEEEEEEEEGGEGKGAESGGGKGDKKDMKSSTRKASTTKAPAADKNDQASSSSDDDDEDDEDDDDDDDETPKQLVERAIQLDTNRKGNPAQFRQLLDAAKTGRPEYAPQIASALKVFKCNSPRRAKDILRQMIGK